MGLNQVYLLKFFFYFNENKNALQILATFRIKSKKLFSNSKIVEILNSTKGKAISASSELYLRPWDCLELQEITAQLCGMDE